MHKEKSNSDNAEYRRDGGTSNNVVEERPISERDAQPMGVSTNDRGQGDNNEQDDPDGNDLLYRDGDKTSEL